MPSPTSSVLSVSLANPSLQGSGSQWNTAKSIAENIFSELKNKGLKDKDIVSVSSELLSRLTADIQTRRETSLPGSLNR
jgi:hypothetical protein